MMKFMMASPQASGELPAALDNCLRSFFRADMESDAFRITTHCMYPSNGLIRVFLRCGVRSLVASDDGEALGEAAAAGIEIQNPDKVLGPFIRSRGLVLRSGVILTEPIPLEEAPIAVAHVANAAKEAAHWLYEHGEFKRKRDFKKLLSTFLEENYGKHVAPTNILGKSHKLHKFNNVISFPNGRKLIVDAASNDASSINARAIANYDVKAMNDPMIEQRIVYDDAESWTSADLSLLQVGATAVPFSRAQEVIRRVADQARNAA